MDLALERQTHDVEEEHWWYRGRRRMIAGVLAALAPAPGTRILDAGCGSGRNLELLARHGVVTGLEPAVRSAQTARARGVGTVVVASLEAPLPFGAGAFDLVTCLDVLEHLRDDRGALRELRRVTAPGGLLLVTVPAHRGLWGSHDALAGHFRRYTRVSLAAAAAQSGWRAVRMTGFNATLLPMIAAARLVDRGRDRAGAAPRSDLARTPRAVNGVLERVLGAEARLIASGRSLPFGVSLVVVLEAI